MNIFKFRVIIDADADVFRDIEISTAGTFKELHHAILKAFDWKEGEMASFYMSNETWDKGQEIPLMDMGGDVEQDLPDISMTKSVLEEFIHKPDEKLVYVYDFMRMWCFYIELLEIKIAAPSTLYPRVDMVYGDAPELESKEMDLFGGFEFEDAKTTKSESTGDPELDAYLKESEFDDDLDDNQDFESLDNLDEYM